MRKIAFAALLSAMSLSSCVVYNPQHNRAIPRTEYRRPNPPKKFVQAETKNLENNYNYSYAVK